jgi:hypothetical protein
MALKSDSRAMAYNAASTRASKSSAMGEAGAAFAGVEHAGETERVESDMQLVQL